MRPVRLAWWIWAFTIAGAMLLAAWSQRSNAENALVFDCVQLAEGIKNAAIYRDVGADLAKLVAFYRSSAPSTPEPRKAVIEREIRRMWKEGLPPGDAAYAVYKRCQAQLGDMGRGA